MTATAAFESVLDRAVTRVDAWRQSPIGPATEAASYKEWMHFCVSLPGPAGGHLLVNLNLTENGRGGAASREPRLIVLASRGSWSGCLETFANESVLGHPGTLDMTLGKNRLAWRRGAFYLQIDTESLTADLRLRPMVLPTVATRVALGNGHSIHWVVIPRLEADGWVQLGPERIVLECAAAYHDHNWGHFRWGGDLSWEWGFVNPADPSCPYSVVLVRVSDRGRHRILSQGLLLWEGDALIRTFQDREIRTTLEGTHLAPRALTIPSIAALLAPGTASGVPARVVMTAGRGKDELTVRFDTSSRARVAIPSDVDPFRLVLLNEACGEASVAGLVDGRAVEFGGAAVMEFVRG